MTSDGTTLLGADDKAGVAIIMETAERLMEQPEIRHGPLRLCFTCDEEMGRGVDHLDPAQIGAVGLLHARRRGERPDRRGDLFRRPGRGDRPRREHPSLDRQGADDATRSGRRPASSNNCPATASRPKPPTAARGSCIPIRLPAGWARSSCTSCCATSTRRRWTSRRPCSATRPTTVNKEFPAGRIEVNITPQYRNMAEGLRREPRAVAYAQRALERLGRQAKLTIVRGGTDGSRLTELGPAHAEPLLRRPCGPFALGMGLSGGDGRLGRVARRAGGGLGGREGVTVSSGGLGTGAGQAHCA